jgi:DHA1 family L-arabinose/isopropyl-beta-D-thiogalactopyranoside export protein-like MFS transporter/DHA1 family inner membrane transport protein
MSVMPLAVLAFFAFGVLLVLPGGLGDALAREFALAMPQRGALASALMFGVGAGVMVSGPLSDRFARRPLFVAASLACAVALGASALAPSYAVLALTFALLGLAAGFYETLLNSAVPEAFPDRAGAKLNLAHSAATGGAALGAPLLGGAAATLDWGIALAALAAVFAALAVCGLIARFPAPPGASRAGARASRLPWRTLAALSLAGAAYVGLESTLSALLPAFAGARALAPSHLLGAPRGTLAISAFWVGLFAARIAFGALAIPARARELVIGGALGAVLLALGGVLPGFAYELWSLAIGLALGAVFPVLVVLAGDAAPARRGTALAIVVAAGSVGGVALPYLAGALGETRGVSAALLALAAASASIALGVQLAARR